MGKIMSSKIQDELLGAVEQKYNPKDDHDEQMNVLIRAVGELEDEGWEALSTEAQDWFNDAADAMNAKKDLPDFPDAEEVEEKATRTRGGKGKPEAEPEPEKKAARRAAKAEPEVTVPEVGDTVVVVTKRGKTITGKLVEIDGDVIVLDVDGEEQEFQRDRVESVSLVEAEAGIEPAEAENYEPEVDDDVIVTTKRGKTAEGKVVEIDDDIIVLEMGDKEEEFDRTRLESIMKKEVKAARRAAKAEPEPEAKPARGKSKEAAAPADKKKFTVADNGGVSVTSRMREVILDNLKADAEEIGKIITKEGLQFRDNTLKLVFADVHKIVKMMRERKMLK